MNPLLYEEKLEKIVRWLARDRYWLAADIRQELYLSFLEVPANTEIPLAITTAKRDTLDILRSKRYNYSWDNRIPHICLHLCTKDFIPKSDDLQSLKTENKILAVEDKIVLESLMKTMTADERTIIACMLAGETQVEIGQKLGLDRSSISKKWTKIKEKCVAKVVNL